MEWIGFAIIALVVGAISIYAERFAIKQEIRRRIHIQIWLHSHDRG